MGAGKDAQPSPTGLAAAGLAVSLWGGGNVLIAGTGMEGISLAFLRLWLGFAVYAAVMAARGMRLRRSQLRAVALGGFFFGADLIAFYLALQHTSVAIAVTVSALQPIGVLAAAAVFFGERVTRTHLTWGALAIVGVAMVVLGAGTEGEATLAGNLWAVAALVCWAGYFIGSKSARRTVDNHSYLVWINLIGAIMLTPVVAVVGLDTDRAISWSGLGWVALIVAVPGSGHVIMNWAHGHTTLTSTSLLTLAMPVVSTGLAAVVLDQSVVPIQIMGIVITLVALAAVTAYNARRPEFVEDLIDQVDAEVI
ncbi:MAG: DMT family transporter [Microthrixaceae bacterium]